MKKPTTFEEALSLVPTHWPLTPDVDIFKEFDEVLCDGTPNHGVCWVSAEPHSGLPVSLDGYFAGRRPIPQEVREQVAIRLLYNAHADVTSRSAGWLRVLYPCVDSEDGGIVVACFKYVCSEDNYGLRKFSSKDKAIEFYNALPSRLSDIDMYDTVNPIESWILAGKP